MRLTRGKFIPIAPLAALYRRYSSWSWPLVRLSLGLPLIAHGGQKLLGIVGLDLGRSSGFFELAGASFGPWSSYFFGITQLVLGGLIVAGFGTRPTAFIATAFLLASVLLHTPGGYFESNGGVEYPLTLLGLAVALMLRGGGDHSIDRRMRAEL